MGAGSGNLVVLRHSITDVQRQDAAQVVVTGSHGGLYSASVAAAIAPAGVVFHDAGVGLDAAGIAGLAVLDEIGLPAAAVDYRSARIGDARDMLRRGRISHVNETAASIGVGAGQPCDQAAALLARQQRALPCICSALEEGRTLLHTSEGTPAVWALDSASLVVPEDTCSIVVTGSHGGLVGGEPARALGVHALFAAFNDAGVGVDEAGLGRLHVLDRRGIAAVTVSHMSARIGSARSSWETGLISHVNAAAAAAGVRVGETLQEFLGGFIRTMADFSGAKGKLKDADSQLD